MTGDHSKLTIQIEFALMRAGICTDLSEKVLEPLPGRRPLVARNLPFEDGRHARTSRIDFLAVRDSLMVDYQTLT